MTGPSFSFDIRKLGPNKATTCDNKSYGKRRHMWSCIALQLIVNNALQLFLFLEIKKLAKWQYVISLIHCKNDVYFLPAQGRLFTRNKDINNDNVIYKSAQHNTSQTQFTSSYHSVTYDNTQLFNTIFRKYLGKHPIP